MQKILIAALLVCAPLLAQIRVTLLGTAGPSMSLDRAEAGTLIQAGGETLLFDCGRGVPERLTQIDAGDVNKVFLTHLHSDHTEGLPVLWMGGWMGRGQNPLTVWGPGVDVDQPAGTLELGAQLAEAYATNTHIRRDLVEHTPGQGIVLDAREISEGVVYQNNGVTVTAFLVDHAPVRPAFGYRIDYAGHSVAISGDTRPSDNLVKFAKGVDVLVHEVFFTMPGAPPSPVAAYHSSPEQAADIFTRVAPALAVYSHLAGGAGPVGDPTARTRAAGYSGPLQVGTDLTTIDIGDKISVKDCGSTATPLVTAVTPAAGLVVVDGSGFSAQGNAVRFTRMGLPNPVLLDATTGLDFTESPTQITAALGGRVASGQWMVSVRNACGVVSPGFQVILP